MMQDLRFFDTHFHLDEKSNYKEIIKEARGSDVNYLLCCGWDFESSKESENFAENFEGVWFAAGIHPHHASEARVHIDEFKRFKENNKFVAVGETGLDFFYDNSDRKTQIRVMENFVNLAGELEKPLIIHCRDKDERFEAYNEIYQMIKDFAKDGGRFVIHCYTGNKDWLEKFLELGAYIGITGIVTFPKATNIREVVPFIPDNKLLVETDSPFLAPKPYRGKKNSPKYLPEVAKKIAEVKNYNLKYLADLTSDNAFKFFYIE